MANTTNLDLVKPLGTDHALISVINGNMDKIDNYAGSTDATLENHEEGMAVVANGDTHAAISAGQLVYIKGHNTLTEGMYTANSAIAANAALTSSNVTACANGGFNYIYDNYAIAYKKDTERTLCLNFTICKLCCLLSLI